MRIQDIQEVVEQVCHDSRFIEEIQRFSLIGRNATYRANYFANAFSIPGHVLADIFEKSESIDSRNCVIQDLAFALFVSKIDEVDFARYRKDSRYRQETFEQYCESFFDTAILLTLGEAI